MGQKEIIDRDTYRKIKKMNREELTNFILKYVNNDFEYNEDDIYMFIDSKSIVGGNGTKYNDRIYYSEYACVDRNGKPGYFTKNQNAPKPNTTVTTTTTSTPTTTSTSTTTIAVTTLPVVTEDSASTTGASEHDTQTKTVGDINTDGVIDSSDASEMLMLYAQVSTGGGDVSDEIKAVADVNDDGFVDSSDASLILEYYAYVSTGGTDAADVFFSKPA